jgi:starvation-inducible DNA-binding protein
MHTNIANDITDLQQILNSVDAKRLELADSLSKLLASTYSLYLKTQNYHWNVRGPMFMSLHQLYEQQYTELSAAIDVIAERIRAMGFVAPGSLKAFIDLSDVKDESDCPTANQMLEQLAKDHALVILNAKLVLSLANELDDDVTSDLMTQRIFVHEKAIWMLNSIIDY